ncbi:MAG: glycosyltransferase family 2 protein [Reichenbachiella sp.]|uniref:glycosyltransferase family 2 protein n=1 Tax=Reichenbachiella sp. TaxID=2184521 RepID=UPI003297D0CA
MAESLDISVVIPLLNEEESLPELHAWIGRVMEEKGFQYEILFVDDGSTDKSWEIISELAEKDAHVKGIKFNRNYGKSAALNTGFKNVSGHVVITMDADLQDSPDEIPGLYDQITKDGYDLVSGWKKKRYDPIMKTIPSKFFNFVARKFSGIKLHDFNCGLKAYKKEVVKSIDVYGEMHRYIPFLAKGQGFAKIGERVVQHQARKYGETKFGLERFIFGFLDLLSISFVSKFKKRPMHFFGSFGTLSFFFGTLITFWIIGRKIFEIQMGLPARDVVDQPLFFLALVAVIIGVQLFLAGFIGEMMTQSSTRKNDYLVSQKIGLKD